MFQNARVSDSPTDMDKWLALVVGNLLHDDVPEDRNFFNGRLDFPEHLFEMVKGWNYYERNSAPYWATDYFYGIKIERINLDYFILDDLNLAYITTNDCYIRFGSLRNVNLSELVCKECVLVGLFIDSSRFYNLTIVNDFHLAKLSLFGIYINELPEQLFAKIGRRTGKKINKVNIAKSLVPEIDTIQSEWYPLRDLLMYGLKNKLFDIPEIKSWFDYETDEDRKEFESLIDGLKDA